LYKYLNPTLFTLATKRTVTTKSGKVDELVVYIIEGDTGRIIHHFFERGVHFSHPVHLLIDENSVITSFVRDSKAGIGQQAMQIVDFYQQQSELEKDTF